MNTRWNHGFSAVTHPSMCQVSASSTRSPLPGATWKGYVNWGSQFPTLWGTDGRARYLDALLHKGRTPWAIEIKVDIDGSGTGIGGYYRHAISQAVLYRQFIRAATPLHAWFKDQDLDADDCRAAVVVPDLTADNARRDHRADLQSICTAVRRRTDRSQPATRDPSMTTGHLRADPGQGLGL